MLLLNQLAFSGQKGYHMLDGKTMINKIEIPDKPFLRVDEFAEIIGVSTQTIHNWIKAGRIAYTKIGKTIRIPKEELKIRTKSNITEIN